MIYYNVPNPISKRIFGKFGRISDIFVVKNIRVQIYIYTAMEQLKHSFCR